MVYYTPNFLDVERVALAEDERDRGPSIVLRKVSVCDQSSKKHKSTHAPADSVRLAPLNGVMEARKVDCIAIGSWVTLRLLGAEIGS